MTDSQRMRGFRTETATDPDAALKRLREDLTAARGPLLEDLGDQVLVTFVHITRAESVAVATPLVPLPPPRIMTPMTRVPGTDVWYHSVAADPRVSTSYRFHVDPPPSPGSAAEQLAIVADQEAMTAFMGELAASARTDEFNPELAFPAEMGGLGPETLLTLPKAEPFPYLDGTPLRGTLDEHVLFDERTVSVYLPPDYDASASYPVVVAVDGEMLIQHCRLPEVFDGAIARGAIPPVILVLWHNRTVSSRMQELACSPQLPAALADELLPWLREHYAVSTDPARVVISGMSYGGLATAWVALERADAFGAALIMSGSFWFAPPGGVPQWLTREYRDRDRRPVRLAITVGSLENVPLGMPGVEDVSMVDVSRAFRDTVLAKGYDVAHYAEVPAGHDMINVRRTVVPALAKLLA
ncbi:alpha/beta hydrolase-fold protein [Allokutzneria oryzae]|uniref:Alpha/beta hydrolase-fold protein n=1 Tax=Allokutzneria oryzae TaxID=1378989 RepID=A0ABV5ZZ57_9PSEU